MYELRNGTLRLENALWSIADDDKRLDAIARALNYHPRQLKEDIKALHDYVQDSESQK